MKRQVSGAEKGPVGSAPHAKNTISHGTDERDHRLSLYRRALDSLAREAATYIDRFYRSPAPYAVLDKHNRIKDCNRALAHLLGVYSSQLRNGSLADHVEKPYHPLFLSTIRQAWKNAAKQSCTVSLARKNGPPVHARVIASVSGGKEGSPTQECGVILYDIGNPRKRSEPLHDRTTIDYLTGVFNRRAGFMALEYMIAESHKESKPLAICLLDLNNLAQINDRYGHLEGDEAIILTAGIITRNIKKSDVVFRIGGDSFLIIFRRCNAELAELVMQRIAGEMEKHNAVSGGSYTISWSSAIEEWNEENDATIEDLVKKACENVRLQKQSTRQSAISDREYGEASASASTI
jgi:diguanylate cyclase (GGDEF)-like protein